MPQTIRTTRPAAAFDDSTREEDVAGFVDLVSRSPEGRDSLAELLPEWLPFYAGRSTNETIRLRGYILAAFERVGLPDAALPYVLEELESGLDAFLVAAAAKALRGFERPTDEVIPFLFKAVANIKSRDDALTFETYRPQWPIARYTTALEEIFRTFGWLGASAQRALPDLEALHADRHRELSTRARAAIQEALDRIRSCPPEPDAGCCNLPRSASPHGGRQRRPGSVAGIELEDQDGNLIEYGELFGGALSIVVFFYSRCNNPNKCSLTIARLARLQQALREAGLEGRIKTAAITYDPEYDLPPRLKAYGENRGILFSPHHRILRARNRFKDLQEHFGLGVNFSSSIVNRHRIELFILDARGRIAATFSRLQWNVEEVLEQAQALLRDGDRSRGFWRRMARALRGLFSAAPALAVAFFPKCPVCWAAYLSMLGVAGLQRIPYSPWLLAVFALLMAVNVWSVFLRSRRRGAMAGFYLCLAGSLAIFVGGLQFEMRAASYLGLAMIVAGSLLSSRPLETERGRSESPIRSTRLSKPPL